MLALGGAGAVGGFKLASLVTRNANTMTIDHAMDHGVRVSAEQLERWSTAGLIKTVSASTP